MPKASLIFAVAAFVAISVSGEPNKPGGKDQHKTESGPPSTVTIVDNSSRQEAANAPAKETPETHTGIEWSNWVVAGVGLLTCWAVWMQAKESAKATKAMRDSLGLQEKAMEQWIILDNWRANVVATDPIAQLRVRVDMVNQTDFPLTLTSGELAFINNGISPAITVTWGAGANTFLPPKIPNIIRVMVPITASQLTDHRNGHLVQIRVLGQFTHIGALKKETPQKLAGSLLCRRSSHLPCVFEAELHMNPEVDGNHRDAQKRQNTEAH
jgi:hypothetical protein